MSYDTWKTDDTPVQRENEYANSVPWWVQFRMAQKNGYAREWLDAAWRFTSASVDTLMAAEAELDAQMRVLVRLDVEVGEPVK